MIGKRVVVGLSGGVDSSVATALLVEQGYEVQGVYLECYNEPGCRTDQDKKDALQVAIRLGIRFQTLDFRKEYREKVIEYFYREYEAGRTPNPDIVCNREIKFGIFYDWARVQGYDYVATGHYARILSCKDSPRRDLQGLSFLGRARDESKDQSYFLWQVPQDHLSHILFPLGNMLKSEVRAKAKELGLHIAGKPDSMGICFIGEVDVGKLLKEKLGERPGEVLIKIRNKKSEIRNKLEIRNSNFEIRASNLEDDYVVVGRHRGLWFYTIGERGGFELDKNILKKLGMHPEKMSPLYVIGKDKDKNQLIVGTRKDVMNREFRIENSEFVTNQRLWVRIRNLGELYAVTRCHSDPPDGETSTVTLSKPIFGVAEGQSAVFYDSEGVLVGGGIIV